MLFFFYAHQAKDELCLKIDNYIRDRIDAAGEVIVEKSMGKVKDGDVIMTFSRQAMSSVLLVPVLIFVPGHQWWRKSC